MAPPCRLLPRMTPALRRGDCLRGGGLWATREMAAANTEPQPGLQWGTGEAER